MLRKIIILFIILCISMSGCSPIQQIVCEPTDKAKLSLENPVPLNLKRVEWIVITKENVDTIFRELKNKNQRGVVFAITGDGYKALALNMQEIKRYLIEEKEVLRLYREYYESDE